MTKSKAFYITFSIFIIGVSPLAAADYSFYFTPSVSVSSEYSDNLFLSESNTEDEITTVVTGALKLNAIGKRSGLDLSYRPSYSIYAEFSDQNTLRHNADLSAWTDLGRNTRLDFRNAFTRTEDPIEDADVAVVRTEDPNLPVDTTLRRGRNTYYQNFSNLRLNHRFGADDSFYLEYSHTLLENQDSTVEDKQSHTPKAGLSYWFSKKWGIGLDAAYEKGIFDMSEDLDQWETSFSLNRRFSKKLQGHLKYTHTIANYDGQRDDETTYNPAAGFSYTIEDDISLSANVGYFVVDVDSGENESGMSIDTRLVKRYRRGSVNMSVLWGYDYSLYGAETLGLEKFSEISFSGGYQLQRRISGNLSGSYRSSEYLDQAVPRDEDTYHVSCGLNWQPLQWMTVGVNYSFRRLASNIDANDYTENRGSINISVFPISSYKL